jgi:hypothetical protein
MEILSKLEELGKTKEGQ